MSRTNKEFECPSGKIPHQTRPAAEAHALSIQKRDGHLPHIYTCKECGFLHVGGGRKSDRPSWLQTHSGPVLPPDKLPRKPYERHKVDAGVTWDTKDVVVDFILKNHNASDRDVARKFGIPTNKAFCIRTEAGIDPYLKRREQRILAELRADPSAHRKAIALTCGVSYEAVFRVIAKFGFAGTGRNARPGPASPLFGKRLSEEVKNKFKAAQLERWKSASPETKAKNADHCRKIVNPEYLKQWRERNPEKAKLVAQACQKKAQLLHPEKIRELHTSAARAKRAATYKAKADRKRALIEELLKQGKSVVEIAKEAHCGFSLITEVRKVTGLQGFSGTSEGQEKRTLQFAKLWEDPEFRAAQTLRNKANSKAAIAAKVAKAGSSG